MHDTCCFSLGDSSSSTNQAHTSSITVVVRAHSYTELAMSRVLKNHVGCDVKSLKEHVLFTLLGCKVHILFWSREALLVKQIS